MDDRSRLIGGKLSDPALYEYDITAYYEELAKHLDESKKRIKNDNVVENFVRIFSLVCDKSSE